MVASFKRGSVRHSEPIFEALLSQNPSKHLLSSENICNDPIKFCSCERSASALRPLKKQVCFLTNWLFNNLLFLFYLFIYLFIYFLIKSKSKFSILKTGQLIIKKKIAIY